jgi:hypothetical protein
MQLPDIMIMSGTVDQEDLDPVSDLVEQAFWEMAIQQVAQRRKQ